MKKLSIIAAAMMMLAGCAQKTANGPARDHHPEWTYNSVVYEVNIRQFTEDGTFNGVKSHLPRLKALGVDVLWLMPMYEIGVEERKGTLGSYYAISDYKKVNPEFGTMEDFEDLVASAHDLGLKVILDWVANQTAPDHVWMTEKPEDFYERDSLGNAIYEYDWTDTRSLNYENEEVWKAQDECMRFWLDKGVDGFRCDAAGEMPAKFWHAVLPALKADYPEIYLLAEAEKPELSDPDTDFDATYAWELHHLMNAVAQGKKDIQDLKDYIARDAEKLPATAFRLMFTSNHDENSWSGTEFERMGDASDVMEVLCFTLPQGQPLVYTGQETGLDRRLEFFEKDPVTDWSPNRYTDFIRTLTELKHANHVLDAGERGGKFAYLDGYPENVLAFSRTADDDSVTVIANLSPETETVVVTVSGREVFGNTEVVEGTAVELEPWGYMVLEKK